MVAFTWHEWFEDPCTFVKHWGVNFVQTQLTAIVHCAFVWSAHEWFCLISLHWVILFGKIFVNCPRIEINLFVQKARSWNRFIDHQQSTLLRQKWMQYSTQFFSEGWIEEDITFSQGPSEVLKNIWTIIGEMEEEITLIVFSRTPPRFSATLPITMSGSTPPLLAWASQS